MNLFNRLVVILLALALCLGGLFVFAASGGWLSASLTAPYPPIARAAAAPEDTCGALAPGAAGAGGGTSPEGLLKNRKKFESGFSRNRVSLLFSPVS